MKILIDSGSDFNCIHPEFARVNNIKFIKAENPFKVVGFGYGLSTVKRLLKSVYSVSRIILRSSNYIPSVFLMSISFYDSLRSKSIVQKTSMTQKKMILDLDSALHIVTLEKGIERIRKDKQSFY